MECYWPSSLSHFGQSDTVQDMSQLPTYIEWFRLLLLKVIPSLAESHSNHLLKSW